MSRKGDTGIINNLRIAVVLLAAGAGRRFGKPKQFERIGGRPLLAHSMSVFNQAPGVQSITLVVSSDRREWAERFVRRENFNKVVRVAVGGKERADSVRAGLAVAAPSDVVLIHDAARVLVSRAIIERVAQAAFRSGAALAARRVPDTLKRAVQRGERFFVQATVPRADLWQAQTPQGFRADVLARVVKRMDSSLTDDVQAAERLGIPVEIVEGSSLNFKVTVPEDLTLCRAVSKGNRR